MYSFPLYEVLKAQVPAFEEVTAFQAGGSRYGVRRAGDKGAAIPLSSEYVTGSYFKTLGVGVLAGRPLTMNDDNAAAPPAVIISHHVWRTAYAADPSVVGSTFIIEGYPFTVEAGCSVSGHGRTAERVAGYSRIGDGTLQPTHG